jgi:ATP-dependent helicase/nuclease subunit B
MSVTFILGRAGSGKTRACLDAIEAALARVGDLRRLIFLVPEQASFQMERALASHAPGGGYTRAAVLSFSRLAQLVISQSHPVVEMLTPRTRRLALRRVAIQSGDILTSLAGALRTAGFYDQLERLVEELLRENVSPGELTASAERVDDPALAQKTLELARVYAGYVDWLGEERIDPAGELSFVRRRLPQLAWLHDASVWVDGFAGFTGQELETLVALGRLAGEVTITVLADPHSPGVRRPQQAPDPLGLFHRTEETCQRLLSLFADAEIPVAKPRRLEPLILPRFEAAPALAALEAGLATPPPVRLESRYEGVPEEVTLYECLTHRGELRGAARWIRTRIVEGGGVLKFRDFAVIARNLDPFAPLIAEVFDEYGLPYFLDRRRPMSSHPLSRFVSALFDTVATDFGVEAVTRLLRTRLLPLVREEAEALENAVVRHAVSGSAMWRRRRWALEPSDALELLADERARIADALGPLIRLSAAGAGTGRDWASSLYDATEALGVRRRVETWITEARSAARWESAELHRLAWEGLIGVLEDLHQVLAETPLAADDVAAILRDALGELTLGLAPPTVDQVLVSAIERSRHPDIQYAWVVGFNESLFPQPPPGDTLLSTAEREHLAATGGAAPKSRRQEAFNERLLGYIALTRPARGLVISYATVSDEGESLLPSPLLDEVRRVLPGLCACAPPEDAPPVCLPQFTRDILAARRDERHPRRRARYERLLATVRQDAASAAQLDRLLRGAAYDNAPAPIGNYRRPADPPDVVWRASPSEVETYLQCPFKHFAQYGLRLDAARGPAPIRWDLGTLAHEVLAAVTREAMQREGGAHALDDAAWVDLLDDVLARFWQQQPADIPQCRPEFVFLSGVLRMFLKDVLAAHAARWRRGRFKPVACEQRFQPGGGKGALKALSLTLAGQGAVHLRGSIDRIDLAEVEGGRLVLVYDYKSRTDPLRIDFLTGPRLQLFLYLLAVEQEAGGRGVVPGGVLLAPLYPELAALDRKYAQAADPASQTMYLYRPRGVLGESAARLLDVQLGPGETSPVAQMARKKDGAFQQRGDVEADAVIGQCLDLARRTVLSAAEGICAGRVDVAPLVEHDTLACRLCDFQDVCRFDRAYNEPRAAEGALPRRAPDGGGAA